MFQLVGLQNIAELIVIVIYDYSKVYLLNAMCVDIQLYFTYTISYKNKKYMIVFYGKVLSQVKTSSWTVACKESNQGHSYHAI